MALRSLAFLLYFFGSSAASLVVPMAGVLCYIAIYHIFPQTTWWGERLEFLGIRYAFVVGVCLIIGTGLNLGRLRFGRGVIHPVEIGFVLIFLAIIFSTTIGLPWNHKTAWFIDKMAKVMLFCFIMSHIMVSRKNLWYLAVLFTILTLYLGHEAYIAPPSAFTRNRLDGIGGPDFRESAGLAIHLFALLPFVVVVLRQKSLPLKIVAFFAACFGVNAILLCRARSAFLAAIITGVLAIWYVPRRHRRWLITVLAMAVIGGTILSDSWFWERMVTIFSSAEERDNSAAGRLQIWAIAWTMFQEHPLGLGIGQFQTAIGYYARDFANRDAHNTYVLCAIDSGIFGLLAYLGTIVMAWITLGHAQRRASRYLKDPDLLEMMIFASRLSLMIYLISSFFVSRFYTEGMWWFIILPVAIARTVENEIRVEARQPTLVALNVDPRGRVLPPSLAVTSSGGRVRR